MERAADGEKIPRPRRNDPCPNHPKMKFKNCDCSKAERLLQIQVHERYVEK